MVDSGSSFQLLYKALALQQYLWHMGMNELCFFYMIYISSVYWPGNLPRYGNHTRNKIRLKHKPSHEMSFGGEESVL